MKNRRPDLDSTDDGSSLGTTLRDALVKSGKALEEDVARQARGIGADDWGPYHFSRAGSEQSEEVDRRLVVTIQSPTGSGSLRLNFMIECKESSGKWIFFHAPKYVAARSRHMVVAPPFHTSQLSKGFLHAGHVANSGMVFFLTHDKWSANPKVISTGIRQCALGSLDVFAQGLVLNAAFGPSDPIDIVLPVLVTTGKLMMIKEKVTLDQIKADSGDLEKYLVHTPALNLEFLPQNYMRDAFAGFVRTHVNSVLSDGNYDPEILSEYGPDLDSVIESITSRWSDLVPSVCRVVQYEQFIDDFESIIANATASLAKLPPTKGVAHNN